MTSPTLRSAAGLLLSALVAVGLSGCGDGSTEEGPSSARTAPNGEVFNADDVQFVSDLIPHHAQAIELVTLAQGRDLSPPTLALIDQIRDRRVAEVESMTDWLTAWGDPIPETTIDHANAHADDADGPALTAGMVDPADLVVLAETTDDAEFEQRWLHLMAEHHQGAIDLAQTEQDKGLGPEVVRLADRVEKDQSAELDQLTGLMG